MYIKLKLIGYIFGAIGQVWLYIVMIFDESNEELIERSYIIKIYTEV